MFSHLISHGLKLSSSLCNMKIIVVSRLLHEFPAGLWLRLERLSQFLVESWEYNNTKQNWVQTCMIIFLPPVLHFLVRWSISTDVRPASKPLLILNTKKSHPQIVHSYCWWFRNPKQPPRMYKSLKIMGSTTYQLVQGYFHQQYAWSYFRLLRPNFVGMKLAELSFQVLH